MDFFPSLYSFTVFIIRLFFLGYFLLKDINKLPEFKQPKKIKHFLLSLSLGIPLYILIQYIFLLFWKMNFFSSNIFINLIIFLLGLIYLIKEKKKGISFKQLIENLLNEYKSIDLKSLALFLLIFFSFILFFYLKYWNLIIQSTSHFYNDPYIWQANSYYILKFGQVNYEIIHAFPAGFPIFLSGMFIQYNPFIDTGSLEQFHFFNKNFPTMLLFFNLLLVMLSLYVKYKKYDVVVIGSVIFFSSSYFLYRSSFLIPTSLVSTFFILFLFCVSDSKYPSFLEGFLIGAAIITHTYNGPFLFLVYYIGIFLLMFIKYIMKKQQEDRIKLRKILFSPQNIDNFLIIFSFLLIFTLNLWVYYISNWIQDYTYYFSKEESSITGFFSNINIPKIMMKSPSLYVMSIFIFFYEHLIWNKLVFWSIIGIAYIYFVKRYVNLLKKEESPKNYLFIILFTVFSLIVIETPILKWVVSDFFYNHYHRRLIEMFSLLIPYVFVEFYYHYIKPNAGIKNAIKLPKARKQKLFDIILAIFLINTFIIGVSLRFERHYSFEEEYNSFLFDFREKEDYNIQTIPDYNRSIHYFANNYQLHVIFQFYFSYDHPLQKLDLNLTQSEFTIYYNENVSVNDYFCFLKDNELYLFICQNYDDFSNLIYQNSELILIGKTNQITES